MKLATILETSRCRKDFQSAAKLQVAFLEISVLRPHLTLLGVALHVLPAKPVRGTACLCLGRGNVEYRTDPHLLAFMRRPEPRRPGRAR